MFYFFNLGNRAYKHPKPDHLENELDLKLEKYIKQ